MMMMMHAELLIIITEAVTLQRHLNAPPFHEWLKPVVMERMAPIQAVSQ